MVDCKTHSQCRKKENIKITFEDSSSLFKNQNFRSRYERKRGANKSVIGVFEVKKHETLIRKNICTPMFIAVLFTIARIWKQPEYPSVNDWIKKTVVYLYNGILFGHKKKEILPFVVAWMDLKSIMLSEMSQPKKDKYHMISLICGI